MSDRPLAEVTLPLPPDVLHPNARTRNYRYRAAMVKKARDESRFLAGRAWNGRSPLPAATVKATFYMPRRRDGDGLNSWLKPYLDGLADAGIVANDSAFTLLPPSQVTGKDAGRKVVLRIEPLGAATAE